MEKQESGVSVWGEGGGSRPSPSPTGPWSVLGASQPRPPEDACLFRPASSGFQTPGPGCGERGTVRGRRGRGAYLGQAERGRIHPGRGGRRRAGRSGRAELTESFFQPPPPPRPRPARAPSRLLPRSPSLLPPALSLPLSCVSHSLSSFPAPHLLSPSPLLRLSVSVSPPSGNLPSLPPNFSPLPPPNFSPPTRTSHFSTSNFQRKEGKKSANEEGEPLPSCLMNPIIAIITNF